MWMLQSCSCQKKHHQSLTVWLAKLCGYKHYDINLFIYEREAKKLHSFWRCLNGTSRKNSDFYREFFLFVSPSPPPLSSRTWSTWTKSLATFHKSASPWPSSYIICLCWWLFLSLKSCFYFFTFHRSAFPSQSSSTHARQLSSSSATHSRRQGRPRALP